MYAVIDTETSGLFDFSRPADADGQPRLANLAIICLDDDLLETSEHNVYVSPDGWSMSQQATRINGLTDAILNRKGQPVGAAIAMYADLVNSGYTIATFNAQYDTKVMRGEMRRAEQDDLFEATPNICLMRACTDVCQIPRKKGKGYKFPKLSEACDHFEIELEEAHTAMGDAQAAVKILRSLAALDKLPEPKVHYAKRRPEPELRHG